MFKKKRKGLIGVGVIVLMIAGTGWFMAAGAFGPDCDRGFSRRGMPDFVKGEIGEFMLWRLDKKMARLDLSDNQQAAYGTLRKHLQETIETGMDSRTALREQVMGEFEKPEPDLSSVITGIQFHLDRMSGLATESLSLMDQFYATLDPEQQARIATGIKEKIEARQNGGYRQAKEAD